MDRTHSPVSSYRPNTLRLLFFGTAPKCLGQNGPGNMLSDRCRFLLHRIHFLRGASSRFHQGRTHASRLDNPEQHFMADNMVVCEPGIPLFAWDATVSTWTIVLFQPTQPMFLLCFVPHFRIVHSLVRRQFLDCPNEFKNTTIFLFERVKPPG